MKHYKVLLYTILGLLLGYGLFQAGAWYNELRHGHESTNTNTADHIITPAEFAVILSLSSQSSFEIRDSVARKQYIVYGDQSNSEVYFLEKTFDEKLFLISWTTYPDGQIKHAVNGNENSFLMYKGMGEFIAYRVKGEGKNAIYGRDLDSLITGFNSRTRAVLRLMGKEDWYFSWSNV